MSRIRKPAQLPTARTGSPSTVDDVARRANVSTATVSRALSAKGYIRPETRERVLQAARELDYAPNAAAKNLRTAQSRKLLVTVPNIASAFFFPIINGIEVEAQLDGYSVILGNTHRDPQFALRYGEMLLRREVDGLIALGLELSAELVALKLKGHPLPIVNGCEVQRHEAIPTVNIDNRQAAYDAMAHLYSLGHEDVAVVTGFSDSPLSRERLRGAQQAASEHKLSGSLAVVTGDFALKSGQDAAETLMTRRKPPTGIFCFSDEMAIGVLEYAYRAGIKVPEELSVVGFDDLTLTPFVRPALTTIAQPLPEIGRATVRMILDIVERGIASPAPVTLAHRLIVRESTGAVRRATRKNTSRARGR